MKKRKVEKKIHCKFKTYTRVKSFIFFHNVINLLNNFFPSNMLHSIWYIMVYISKGNSMRKLM